MTVDYAEMKINYSTLEVNDMKKLVFYMFLLVILTWTLVGYSKNANANDEQYIHTGTYIMQESQEPVKPIVSLKDSNNFTFTYSALSSYIAIGSYEVYDGNLILKTDHDKYRYVFKIKDNALIFNAKQSSKIPSFANVPDGAIFK
ncbi:hypothetical protein SDC9_162994 [bioreactor metagenome]|uniref:Uncharacterized protein n=1 Tax=bioreactor metagenome TaxID=1076179 RepID=A0A645FNY7_9ZZZZ